MEEFVLNDALYKKKFNKVLIVSPYDLPTLPCIEGENYFKTFSPETIIEKLNEIGATDPAANVLVIIDDFIASIKRQGYSDALLTLLYNRRKLIPKGTVSFIITGQKYIVLPPTLRSVLTGIIVFPVQGPDWETIAKENVFVENNKLAREIILRHWKQDKHNFIFINLQTGITYLNFKLKL